MTSLRHSMRESKDGSRRIGSFVAIARSGAGARAKSIKSNDLNPIYGETFVFNNIPDLQNMILKVRVMDQDFGSRDDKVGWCNIKLDELGLSSHFMNIDRVIDRNVFTANGKIHLKLAYAA